MTSSGSRSATKLRTNDTFLDYLFVSPEQMRQGIGSRLMRQVAIASIETYPERGLWLWVRERNIEARRFYERLRATNAGSEMITTYEGIPAKMLRMYWGDPRGLV
jgi:ribosomal protein S18 acetylase RimI-like enzyme